MRIGIVGSRHFTNERQVVETIAEVFDNIDIGHFDAPKHNITIVSGGAKGVDTFAKTFARISNCDFIMFEPYFLVDRNATYSPRHFFIRNKQIVYNIDMLIAIWDGKSAGTSHTIKVANKVGVPVIERILEPVNEEETQCNSIEQN